jgi:FkbM family methyltransferase
VLRFLPDSLLQFAKKIHYARVVRKSSERDEPDLFLVKLLVEPGQTAADIGANIGTYSKELSGLVGPKGKVISVEPIPPTFEILSSNLRKLHLSNVEAKNVAVSDVEATVQMQIPKFDSGGENFYAARIKPGPGQDAERSFRVLATTVDKLLASTMVHFIKCDVEGHELNCIRGAVQTIERCHPAWLIEMSGNMDDENSSASQTVRILREHGYQAYWLDGKELKLRKPGVYSVNYFFLTSAHIEHLGPKRSVRIA